MRIGIYGGTFNPIHNGHIHVIREFFKRLNLQKLFIIPTCVPPHKSSANLASAEDRLNMCVLAAKELDFKVEVSDIEIKRSEKSYTADTLMQIKEMYPQDELFFLMGEDMFMTIDKWYKPEIIFSLVTICVSPRSTFGLNRLLECLKVLQSKFSNLRCIIEDIEFYDISSTQIRTGSIDAVPPTVAEYINKRKLYNGECDGR